MQVTYAVIFERAKRNCAAYVPDVAGCMTTGRMLEEAQIKIFMPGVGLPSADVNSS